VVSLAPGAVGGCCNVIVGFPMDLVKVRMQASGPSTLPLPSAAIVGPSPLAFSSAAMEDMALSRISIIAKQESPIGMLRGIFVQEGISGLYRGVSAPLVAVVPAFALNFWSYDMACRKIRTYSHQGDRNEQLSIFQTALAGGVSGLFLASVIGPSDRIKCLMQVNKTKNTGFMDCARSVYQEGGIRSIFRGTGATILRDVPGNAAYFGAYEFLKRLSCQMEGRDHPSTFGILFSGGFAGVANWMVAIPFDTIKTRYQTAPAGTYRNLADVFHVLIRTEGAPALFRGLSAALLRAFPANAACLFGVETVQNLLADRR
jgi:solute carrier family 25 carnitine/acylcarnitine transporter 20/29